LSGALGCKETKYSRIGGVQLPAQNKKTSIYVQLSCTFTRFLESRYLRPLMVTIAEYVDLVFEAGHVAAMV
jgi:hypothetical protein